MLLLGAGGATPTVNLISYDADSGQFVDAAPAPDLTTVRSAKILALAAVGDRTITSGFASSALGSAYTYPAKDTDQANMGRVAFAGGKLWAKDSTGSWGTAPRNHTAAQGVQVLTDFGVACDAARLKLANLKAQVVAATTADAINAVAWG